MELIKMAWRNIWRNKKRTAITASALYLAVFIAVFMRSLQIGTYDIMVDNAVGNYLGFIQLQHPEYLEEKTIDELMEKPERLDTALMQIDGVEGLIPRLESFALASSGDKTKPVLLQGIHPVMENQLTNMEKKLVSGRYLHPDDDGVLLSQRLADFLALQVGDTLILISQGYHGVSAADLFPVRGIVRIPSPIIDNKLVVGALDKVQQFYSAPDMLSSLVVDLEARDRIDDVLPQIKSHIEGEEIRALRWEEIDRALKQQIDFDNYGGVIMVMILYLVIFFGLLGTVIMMTSERLREFAVMQAVGMHRKRLVLLTSLETIFLGLLALLAAFLTAVPLIRVLAQQPIKMTGEVAQAYEQYGLEPMMGFATDISVFFTQALIVFVLLLLSMLYPLRKIRKFSLIHTLRG